MNENLREKMVNDFNRRAYASAIAQERRDALENKGAYLCDYVQSGHRTSKACTLLVECPHAEKGYCLKKAVK